MDCLLFCFARSKRLAVRDMSLNLRVSSVSFPRSLPVALRVGSHWVRHATLCCVVRDAERAEARDASSVKRRPERAADGCGSEVRAAWSVCVCVRVCVWV